MNDTHTEGAHAQVKTGERDRLDSWKKIAAHFNRDVTTVQRWERREGMPVHRHVHDKQGSVYAFRAELDAWEGRRGTLPDSGDRTPEAVSEGPLTPPGSLDVKPASEPAAEREIERPLGWRAFGLAAIIAAVLVLLYAALRFGHFAGDGWNNPLATARVTRLTDWPGIEQAAEVSRDGRWAAFMADHDGRMDAWLTRIGSGSYRNLTRGDPIELVNPSIRTLGFSADGSLVTVWTRSADGSHPDDIKVMAAPTAGGVPRDFLKGVAEVAWSHDGGRIAYHTTAPGDPIFVRDARGNSHPVYVAPSGVHCHFLLWSWDDSYIYFARGIPPGDWDLWRIHPSGAGLEQLTFHDSRVSHPVLLDEHTLLYLASDAQGSGPWLYALNLEERVPHRISFGLESYTSLAASGDGTRLVATVDESHSSIWSAPLRPDPGARGGPGAAQLPALVSATGLSPRMGPDYLLYVSSRAGRPSIWKVADGQSRELWSDAHASIVGAPAVAPDGRHIAFTLAQGERTILYTMASDGGELRMLTRSLELRGNPAWAPDGRSICAALREGEPRLTNIFLDGGPPSPLVSEYWIDPVFSPDGEFLIYSGADVGTTFPLRAVTRDGRPYPIPALILTRGARRVAFPDARSIVLLRGDVGHKSFSLVDLRTGAERQITELGPDIAISDFDLSRDGSVVLFARAQKSSRIALIERGG